MLSLPALLSGAKDDLYHPLLHSIGPSKCNGVISDTHSNLNMPYSFQRPRQSPFCTRSEATVTEVWKYGICVVSLLPVRRLLPSSRLEIYRLRVLFEISMLQVSQTKMSRSSSVRAVWTVPQYMSTWMNGEARPSV